jgi:hypothetical protein
MHIAFQANLRWTLRLGPLACSQEPEKVAHKHGFEALAGALSKQTTALRG